MSAALPYVAPADELCPHLERRRALAQPVNHEIRVQAAGGKWMALCRECYEVLGGLRRGYHERRLGAKDVGAAMMEMGYTRRDVARFVLDLVGEKLKVKVGFLSEADL